MRLAVWLIVFIVMAAAGLITFGGHIAHEERARRRKNQPETPCQCELCRTERAAVEAVKEEGDGR